MIKSEYFCDRCSTQVSSNYALYQISIQQKGMNSLVAALCDKCVMDMVAVSKGKAVSAKAPLS